jgi:alpha-beta hydrolase superfamily lysophospholipase
MPFHESWFTAADGLRLRQRCWLPSEEPAALVVFVHGFTEHSLRHEQAASAIAQHGYAVHAIDLRGHGLSQGARVWIRSFDEHLDDVERFVRHVREANPAKPLFLWGNSLGGTIAVLLAIQRHLTPAGIILSGALLKMPDQMFPILRHLAIVVSRMIPGLRVVGLGSQCLSRDPEVVAAFRADPLNFHGRFPVRTGAEILRAVRSVGRHMEDVEVPLLLLHGTGDVVTDPEGSRQLHARAASKDKTLRLYPGLYHDLLHEPEWKGVVADALAWIDDRCRPQA